MTGEQLAYRCTDVATNYKTLYVMGCFGAPMTAANKQRYCNNHSYNRQAGRQAMIKAADAYTFGFDCVNLIKGILWGWNGNYDKQYGGAQYAVNGVPDVSADGMIKLCKKVSSTGWKSMAVGEAVWMSGHIGVYIGNGLAVECTPKWSNCVQITAVGNIGKKSGYNTRTWTKHGKIPYVTYTTETEQKKEEEEDMTEEATRKLVQEAVSAAVKEALPGILESVKPLIRTMMAEQITERMNAPATGWIKPVWDDLTQMGVTDGSRPQDYCSREECGLMLSRAREAFAKQLRDNDCGEWSTLYRTWAIEAGLVKGVGDNPDGSKNYAWESPVTREQAAAMFYRMAERCRTF